MAPRLQEQNGLLTHKTLKTSVFRIRYYSMDANKVILSQAYVTIGSY